MVARSGIFYALLAYLSWGLIPAYLKLVSYLPLTQVLFHRSLWAFLFFTSLVYIGKKRGTDFFHFTQKQKLYLVIATGLLGLNWSIYLYAVNSNQVVEGSLGYFINPLINFLLGFLFLNESFSKIRRLAVGSAAMGVLWLTFWTGHFPWIGLSLGLSFGLYGLVRKVARMEASSALQVESLLLSFIWLFIFSSFNPNQTLLPQSETEALLLLGTGFATGLPLLWFSKAALVTPLNVLGFLQFISPTLQFLLGVFFYQESFSSSKLIGFAFIWLGVLILLLEFAFVKRSSPHVR